MAIPFRCLNFKSTPHNNITPSRDHEEKTPSGVIPSKSKDLEHENTNHSPMETISPSGIDDADHGNNAPEFQTESVVTKRRRVSFKTGFTDSVYEIPHRIEYSENNLMEQLFYSDSDYQRFRASEEKRYEKMVMKKLQKMVMEKMQPTINDAVANGATLQDIEAMVPKTREEMIAYLGDDKNVGEVVEAASFGKVVDSVHARKLQRNQPAETSSETNKTIIPSSDEDNNNKSGGNEEPISPKRTIRNTRSSIQISPLQNGRKATIGIQLPTLTEAAAEAMEASEQLIAAEESLPDNHNESD